MMNFFRFYLTVFWYFKDTICQLYHLSIILILKFKQNFITNNRFKKS